MPKPHQGSMCRNRVYHWLLGLSVSVVVVLVGAIALAQGGAWDLGPYQFVNGPPSGPLLSKMGPGSLGSYGFVGKIGGVAFGGVASPDGPLASKTVSLVYDSGKADGSRLGVRIGDSVYVQALPDWQLVPIAKYADSDYNACVSLFGERTNEAFYDIVYHPAFENTLLGLRLLQADIILFDIANMWRLPAFEGKVVLGKGESEPEGLDRASANKVISVLRNASFQSWVLTDEKAPILFTTAGKDGLHIAGEPYYHFWTSDFASYKHEWNALAEKAQTLKSLGNIKEYNKVATQINSLEPKVSEVKDLTARLKSISADMRKLNPQAYDAATSTMRYAALFRYVKRTNQKAWSAFLREVNTIRPLPNIITPTSWSRQH